jgi:biotin carboxylase/isopentenyl diphosphate isomerase/L-lactate dehydrogenase-like FMN-dependent dehydrogenase
MKDYNVKGKTLLVIGAGLLQLPVILKAKELGMETVVVDGNPNAVGIKAANHFIRSSTLDIESTLYEAEKFHTSVKNIDGVLTVGTDASYTVAMCAKKLGLTGIEPEAAMRATDKFLMRKALRAENVPVPDFEIVDAHNKAIEIFEKLEGDCVIKPVSSMGARGVRRITHLDDLKEAYEQAKSFSPSGKVVIEKFIEAPELSIDALIYDGKVHVTGIADRIIEYDPYFVETGHIMPSELPDEQLSYAAEIFEKGIRAIGITVGAAKGDIKISSSGCFIGEIAARLSGGFMSTYTYPYSSGVDLMENVIYIALGLPPADLTPKKEWVSIERAIIAPPGVIQSIKGIEEAKKIQYVTNIFFDAKVGDKVISPRNNLDKSGHIIVAAPTRHEAILASHEAVRAIQVETIEDDDQKLPQLEMDEFAKEQFNGRCFVCEDCNGVRCKGMLPGMGGIGTGLGFIRSVERLRRINLIPNYISPTKDIDTSIELFGMHLDIPVMPAPITGAITNLGGAITELNLARSIVKGANQAGTVGFVGDGATPTKYRIGVRVILENFGMGIPVFKPRFDQELITQRIDAARESGALAVGMDIDAASFKTMEMKKQNTSTKTFEELKELVDYAAEMPFMLKGVLSVQDAKMAIKAGCKALIISNHGGRVSDNLLAPIDALIRIREVIGDEAVLILDGGVRSGGDVAVAIACGADAVMIGRPVTIAAVGGRTQGVRQYFQRIGMELKRMMTLLGISDIQSLKNNKEILYFEDHAM